MHIFNKHQISGKRAFSTTEDLLPHYLDHFPLGTRIVIKRGHNSSY